MKGKGTMTTAASALNFILANACPGNSAAEGWTDYRIDLCCKTVIITARRISTPEYWTQEGAPPRGWFEDFRYEVKDFRLE